MSTLRPIFAATLLCALSSTAHAKLFCVSNGLQLDQALVEAQTYDTDDEIRIGTGYINTFKPYGGVRWRYEAIRNDDLKVSGGWNAFGGCTVQDPSPTATRIAAGTFGPAFQLQVNVGLYPTLTFSNFTLQDGAGLENNDVAGLSVRIAAGAAPIVKFERVVLYNHAAFNGNGGGLSAGVLGGQVSFLGCWIIDNAGRSSVGASLNAVSPGVIYFNNNTVRGNLSNIPEGIAGVQVFGNGSTWLANNVIVDNLRLGVAVDFRANDGSGLLNNNHIGALVGTVGFQSQTTTGNALLDAIADTPTANSPVRNTGYNSPPGGLPSANYSGNARIQGGKVDRGAFEFDELFGNGFE